jgi:PGF-CTERM protein
VLAPKENVTPASPEPTVTTTAAPTATPAKEKLGAEPENGLLPGFEAMFAITGLLAVAYLVRRRRR